MSITDSIQYLRALRSLQKGRNLMYKSAAQPPMDPSMGGGAPPMDPSMGGGAPPMDPSMGGMPPGGDPSMGGMPPGMDPSMMGGAPPMDPSMMGGMPPMDPSMMMPPPAPPAPAPQETEQKVTNKIKTEQWMQHIDSYNYNLLKLMINLYEHLGIPVPAESLLPQPLGSNSPSAGDISGMMGAAADATSPQSPIDAMTSGEAAPPEGGVMGGAPGGDMGGMPPGADAGAPPPDAGAGAPPPMEGGDVKQSSWNGYYNYYNRQFNPPQQQKQVNPSWQANYKKQAGISPVTKQASYQQPVLQYPRGYNAVMQRINNMRGFNK